MAYENNNGDKRIIKQKRGDYRKVDGVQAMLMSLRDIASGESDHDFMTTTMSRRSDEPSRTAFQGRQERGIRSILGVDQTRAVDAAWRSDAGLVRCDDCLLACRDHCAGNGLDLLGEGNSGVMDTFALIVLGFTAMAVITVWILYGLWQLPVLVLCWIAKRIIR